MGNEIINNKNFTIMKTIITAFLLFFCINVFSQNNISDTTITTQIGVQINSMYVTNTPDFSQFYDTQKVIINFYYYVSKQAREQKKQQVIVGSDAYSFTFTAHKDSINPVYIQQKATGYLKNIWGNSKVTEAL
jgi:hypothetical protein